MIDGRLLHRPVRALGLPLATPLASRKDFSRVARIGLLLAVSAGCAPAAPPVVVAPLPVVPVEEPLDEADIQIISALIAHSDRREQNYSLMSSAVVSPEPAVRRQAVYAAARIGGEESRSLARHLLADPDSTVAAVAAFALGELADSSAVSLLSEQLLTRDSSSSALVRAETAEALGKIGNDAARATIRGLLIGADSSTAATEAGVIGAALLAGWRAGITESGPFARWTSSPEPEIRWRAVYALTRRRHPDAVPILRTLLGDPDPRVRSLVLRGLQRPLLEEAGISSADLATGVLPLLRDSAYSVRIEAIRTLATYGPGPALDAVMATAAGGGQDHERAAAIEALGRAGADAAPAAPLLLGLALDPSVHTFLRQLAIEAVAAVDGSAALANLPTLLRESDWRVRAATGRALASLPASLLAVIAEAVRDRDPRVGAAALLSLSERQDSTSLLPLRSLLVEALGAGDVFIRAHALMALTRTADAALFPFLLDAFTTAQGDSVPDARLAAIDAIADQKDHGVPFPERVFFARFTQPTDYLTRLRALERFGADARGAWDPPFPLESGTDPDVIDWMVRRWIAPAGADSLRPHVRVETNRGDLVLELFPREAPLTVANFLSLARVGFFDGQEWPRVVPNFVVQGGDPRGDTSGGPAHVIRDEMNVRRYTSGTLGMALAGPDTGGSQFFITHSDQPHLDGTYTVFGRLLSGQSVLELLLAGDRIIRITEIPASVSDE